MEKPRHLITLLPLALAAAILPSAATAETSSITRSMSFEACVATIQKLAGQLGAAPINIVETSDLRIVRFMTVDGSVLITCSRPDRKAIITQSVE